MMPVFFLNAINPFEIEISGDHVSPESPETAPPVTEVPLG